MRDRTRVVVGIGELLWDLLPGGPRLGGAPFNVVAHLRRLGCDAHYMSAVGQDDLGRRALAEVAGLGVGTDLVEFNDRPTGTVRVTMDVAGTPEYEIVSPAAYEVMGPLGDRHRHVAAEAELLVFGTLAQRFSGVNTLMRKLTTVAGQALRLYDVNLRRGCWDPQLVADLLEMASVTKLNLEEQGVLADALGLPLSPIEAFARAAVGRYGLRGVCVTRGPLGAALLLDDVYQEAPSPSVQVVDTVGAGDAFVAGLGYGLINGWSVGDVLSTATALGSLVASREGAIPSWHPSEIGLPDALP